jgi:hypothetical protein
MAFDVQRKRSAARARSRDGKRKGGWEIRNIWWALFCKE